MYVNFSAVCCCYGAMHCLAIACCPSLSNFPPANLQELAGMPTNLVLMFNPTLSPCHGPKKTCGVGGHPTRSGVNNIRYFTEQMQAFAHARTHTHTTQHAHTLTLSRLSYTYICTQTYACACTHNKGGRVTQGRKLAGREAEVFQAVPVLVFFCLCIRSCGLPISRLAAQ